MARRLLLAGLAAAAVLWLPSAASAVRPITPPAPEFPQGSAWVNASPFTMKRLRGRRVVLVTFFNGNTANSIRTLPILKRWWDRYALEGLMIIGIYDADYGFDRDPRAVRQAIRRLEIKFPVLIDTDRRLWKGYNNDGWPAHFLIDHRGNIIHDRVGEGGYREFEEEILLALGRFNGYDAPKGYKVPKDSPRLECQDATKPFYLGGSRGKTTVAIRPHELLTLIKTRDGEVGTMGLWRPEAEALRFAGTGRDMKSRLRLIYQGAEALGILAPPPDGSGRLYIQQDSAWLHAGNANTDVQWDDEDRSYVEVESPRLHYLTKNRKWDMHELVLMPLEEGLGVAGFEFSDYCQTEYDHR